jgi:hypothetical protein
MDDRRFEPSGVFQRDLNRGLYPQPLKVRQ